MGWTWAWRKSEQQKEKTHTHTHREREREREQGLGADELVVFKTKQLFTAGFAILQLKKKANRTKKASKKERRPSLSYWAISDDMILLTIPLSKMLIFFH